MRDQECGGGGLGQGVLNPLLAEASLAPGPDGGLRMDGVALPTLAEAVGTPMFVYSAAAMRRRYQALDAALAPVPHRIHYSVKANSNLAVLRVMRELGAGADIVSLGELRRCTAAGFPPGEIVFSGVGKTAEELEAAARAGLRSINVESLEELEALGAVAQGLGRGVAMGIRWNPDVLAGPHPHIRTGHAGIKFGVPVSQLGPALALLARCRRLRLEVLAIHLGSQVLEAEPFAAGAQALAGLLDAVRGAGISSVTALDVGGGLGIRYEAEEPLAAAEYAASLLPWLPPSPPPVTLLLEPGRFLVGSAGVLLTRVLYRKNAGARQVVVVDAGMTELGRPSRYGAYHEIVPVCPRGGPAATCDIVGPVCETGDFLALGRTMAPIERGDLLAVLGAGAYGFVMGSNYNARPRVAEVLVDGGAWGIARARERVDDLMRGEVLDPIPAAVDR